MSNINQTVIYPKYLVRELWIQRTSLKTNNFKVKFENAGLYRETGLWVVIVSAGGRSLTAWQALKTTAGDETVWILHHRSAAPSPFLPHTCSLYIHKSIQICADARCCTQAKKKLAFEQRLSESSHLPFFSRSKSSQVLHLNKSLLVRTKWNFKWPPEGKGRSAGGGLGPNQWAFFTEICPFGDCPSSLSRVWLKRWMRAPGTRAMHAMASSCSSHCPENRSSSDDTSESMTPVWTQMKLYGRRPVIGIKNKTS